MPSKPNSTQYTSNYCTNREPIVVVPNWQWTHFEIGRLTLHDTQCNHVIGGIWLNCWLLHTTYKVHQSFRESTRICYRKGES